MINKKSKNQRTYSQSNKVSSLFARKYSPPKSHLPKILTKLSISHLMSNIKK